MALMFLNGDGMRGGRAHAEHDLGIHKDITSHGNWRAYRASVAFGLRQGFRHQPGAG
jgi:hypothetical protein